MSRDTVGDAHAAFIGHGKYDNFTNMATTLWTRILKRNVRTPLQSTRVIRCETRCPVHCLLNVFIRFFQRCWCLQTMTMLTVLPQAVNAAWHNNEDGVLWKLFLLPVLLQRRRDADTRGAGKDRYYIYYIYLCYNEVFPLRVSPELRSGSYCGSTLLLTDCPAVMKDTLP